MRLVQDNVSQSIIEFRRNDMRDVLFIQHFIETQWLIRRKVSGMSERENRWSHFKFKGQGFESCDARTENLISVKAIRNINF